MPKLSQDVIVIFKILSAQLHDPILQLCLLSWDSVPSPHSLAADGTRSANLTEHGQKRVEGEMDVEWAGPQMCYGGPKGLLGNEIPISL